MSTGAKAISRRTKSSGSSASASPPISRTDSGIKSWRGEFKVHQSGDIACDDEFLIPDYKFPIEMRLVKYLRMWRGDPNAIAASGRTVEQEIAFLLEWYICECIPYGPANLSEWWSDGVEKLEITQTAEDSFNLLGVTWIGSLGNAPFEIDVKLNPADDHYFAKTIFRIGTLDERGRPTAFHHRVSREWILGNRPRDNRVWAMAVELTPPSTKDE
jgi:hypothetical protein